MRRLSFLASLATLMFAVGCETDEMAANNSQIELNLKGTISSLQKSTRVNSSGFEAEDKVGVYVSNRGSLLTSGNMVDNAAFIYNDGALAAESGEKVYWGSESVRLNVYAYYPYAASVADNTAYPFSVAANQSTEVAFYNSDFLTASALDLAPQTTPVELAFDHSLSRVNIALTAGTDITQEELSSAAKTFTLDGYILGGKINLSNGEAEVNTTSSSTITPLAVDGTSYSAIVYPQSGTLTFTLNLNGEIYTYSAEYDYEAGYQYQYTLKINARKPIEMILESTSINPWEDGEPTEGEMSDIITFADAAFKEFLLSDDCCFDYNEESLDGIEGNTCYRIDSNNDNEISISEINAVSGLAFYINAVSNYEDLQHFDNLKMLAFYGNLIETPNPVTSIVLPQLNSLERIVVHSCRGLQSIDFTQCKNLKCVFFEYNDDLKDVSFSQNTKLEYLTIVTCDAIDPLDLSNNKLLKHLILNDGGWYGVQLDLSNNPELETLCINTSLLKELDVSKNTKLASLVFNTRAESAILYMAEGQEIAEMELGENIEIQYK